MLLCFNSVSMMALALPCVSKSCIVCVNIDMIDMMLNCSLTILYNRYIYIYINDSFRSCKRC